MSIATESFLVEIGTEELPPKALKRLSEAFASGIEQGLKDADLAYGEVLIYAAPRRLAVHIEALQTVQADKVVERKGPAKKVGFDADGNPSKALQGFARGCGATVEDLIEIETDKGIWMAYLLEQKGQIVESLLPDIVSQSLAKLPIPKRMRWGDSDIEFVRPVHWVLMLLGHNVVPATILGHVASNTTKGHRFHAPAELIILHPNLYVDVLRIQGYVLADFAERSASVYAQVTDAAQKAGGTAVISEALLEEVTALNEWPVAVVGDFDARFLTVPPEALVSAMAGHQKYFHMLDGANQLMAKFITVSNIESTNPASVKFGNERVIRPRLADAKFFWDQDNKQSLEQFFPRLKTVVFQKQLGTLFDKVERLESLTVIIGKPLGVSAEIATRAARLSKCDLLSEMVGEFPDLQGVMGRYYATEQNENSDVAEAIEAQYRPRFSGDDLPGSAVAQALAIADKLDTITGIFGVGQIPTGDKDPFALRRAALGLVRIMIEKQLNLNLFQLIQSSLALHESVQASDVLTDDIYDFIIGRLRAYYADQGMTTEQFEAVRVCRPTHPFDFAKRMEAVKHFSQMPSADSLSAANKRISNILKKNADALPETVNSSLFEKPAETELWNALEALRETVNLQVAQGNYVPAIESLATIRETVDHFFDDVMVMAEDTQVRQNRLALLNQIYQLFLQVADVSRL
ncbi:Glycyl-tRNA synthetase beta chain [hydrothermal vent metagenome]|uniref:glycine--tRNA ligase n=1 Tax=hydrothermal vent metagenome TaxID=652676 RepID=A0A3B0W6T2_9ZZZZ